MATNLINMFKIGQMQGPNGASSAGKVDFGGNNKPNSIFNAAGMNGLAEDSIGDSFTRTTNKTQENTQVENKSQDKTQEKANNATNPNNANNQKTAGAKAAAGKSNISNFGLTQGSNASDSNKFGMLSSTEQGDAAKDATEKTGFGSLSVGGGTKYTVDKSSELQELAEELGCEAKEDVVKNQLQKMDAKDLAKLDSNALDIAEDLDLISMKDIEEKTGVSDKDLKNADKKQDKKIKFGTMTSGDMV